MSTQRTIDTLARAIAEAQSLLEELKTSALTREGWSSVTPNNHPVPRGLQDRLTTRHGCAWNMKEKRDLMRKWLQFTSVQNLALIHHRSEHSIRAEMQRLLNTANVEKVLDAIIGDEKNEALQAQVDVQSEALRKIAVIGNEDGLTRDEYQQRLIASAGYARAALTTTTSR